MCLSREDIAELTRARTRKRQIEFLCRNGIRHFVDTHGWPVVTRAAAGFREEPTTEAPEWKPNKAR